jgi:hypothetical protein
LDYSSIQCPPRTRFIVAPSPLPRAFLSRLWFVFAYLVLLSSCADLAEITKFANSSKQVGDSFSDIAAEAARSCARANTFIGPRNPVTLLDCGWYAGINPSLVAVNKALFDYIASLGKLGSSDTSKVGSGMDNLGADLKKGDPNISPANLSKATAAGGLVKALTEIWASGYRERKLTAIIQHSNDAVQDVTAFLDDYAADAFRQTLEHEREYESSYCDLAQSPKTEPLATYLLNKSCDADAAELAKKLAAVQAYRDSLHTIRLAHANLAKTTGHWDVSELNKAFGSSISDLAKAASTIRKAF